MNSQATVTTLPIPELTLSANSVSITTKGGTADAPTLGGNTAAGVVTYEISNEKVATINKTSGKITAVANGTAVATVSVAATETTAASQITFNVFVSGQDKDASAGGSGSGTLPGGDSEDVVI